MNNLPVVISILSLLLAAYTFLHNDTKQDTTELTTVIVKLENIGLGITDIKSEMTAMRNDQKEDHDKLIKVESSLVTAWKRIDELMQCKKNATV